MFLFFLGLFFGRKIYFIFVSGSVDFLEGGRGRGYGCDSDVVI